MAQYLRNGCGDLTEVASDNDDVKDDDDDDNDDDDDDDNDNDDDDDVEVVKICIGEIVTILDRLVNLEYLSKEERNFPVATKFKLDKIRALSKKQNHISDHFTLQSSLYDRFH